eukprot:5757992-Heterocapsa_arctica.AAC.1
MRNERLIVFTNYEPKRSKGSQPRVSKRKRIITTRKRIKTFADAAAAAVAAAAAAAAAAVAAA